MDSRPSEKLIPSRTVGTDLNVLNTRFESSPFSNGVYRFGSKVSVWAIPPAIHNRMTVSAVDAWAALQDDSILLRGTPAAKAASVAALVDFKKSRLFHLFFIGPFVS